MPQSRFASSLVYAPCPMNESTTLPTMRWHLDTFLSEAESNWLQVTSLLALSVMISTTITTHMDSLAQHIADLQRKVTAFNMDTLPFINSDVYAAAMGGTINLRALADDVRALVADLTELCSSADGAAEAHADLIQELERLASEEDSLDRADVASANGAGTVNQPSCTTLASA